MTIVLGVSQAVEYDECRNVSAVFIIALGRSPADVNFSMRYQVWNAHIHNVRYFRN